MPKPKKLLRLNAGHNRKVLQVLVPWEVFDYITLLALSKGRTYSSLVCKIVEDWYEQESQTASQHILVMNIIRRAWIMWNAELTQSKYETFEDFIDQYEKELDPFRLNEDVKTEIIQALYAKNEQAEQNLATGEGESEFI